MNRLPRATLLLPILLLAACGDKGDKGAAATNVVIETASTHPDYMSSSSDDGGMTAIDAATGDAHAMPADSSGPTAYDLEKRENGSSTPAKREEAQEKAADATPSPQAETLPAAD